MSQKSELYNIRKTLGPLTTSYAQYTVSLLDSEIAAAGVKVVGPAQVVAPEPEPDPMPELLLPEPEIPDHIERPTEVIRVGPADPNEMPGQRLNTLPEDTPLRIDDEGRAWFQEEVRKPAYPKPRGRRVLKYMERGVMTETVQNGEYVETFEVAGVGEARPAEVKITLPSYQVGIYKDPRFPFKIHCYNGSEGFNLFEVHDYYGGAELVPDMCKRIYIENDLCYDVRSVVRAIQNEYRQLQLMGKV